jgi:two-component system sensor histidine kinase TctE
LDRLDGVELVREVAREWAPQALDKGVETGFEMSGGEAWVMGDAQLLREMLANLIDNALRYGGTRIMLAVSSSEQGVTWFVEDNGPGIPEQQREAVFAPFHRLSSGVDGAGLGLTIVQRIAHLHAARVSLESAASGTGLVVRVTFPLATA